MHRNFVTEMYPDRNGQTETGRPNRPDRKRQTEKSCSANWQPWNLVESEAERRVVINWEVCHA